MKRYIVFTWSSCYPAGGWNDYRGSFDSLDGAEAFLLIETSECQQIVDYGNGYSWRIK